MWVTLEVLVQLSLMWPCSLDSPIPWELARAVGWGGVWG